MARYETVRNPEGVAVNIWRDPAPGPHLLREIAEGIEQVGEIRRILNRYSLDLDFIRRITVMIDDENDFYMYVNDKSGQVIVCRDHLLNSDLKTVFLDIIHETVHIFQLSLGMDLFDKKYRYIDRPTELEAYEAAVAEGKKLGMADSELFDYLAVDWVNDSDHLKLAEKLGVARK
ncbi:MAG: hypothetical protein KIY10_01330 [Thermoplasmata archaeon]|jgi:hypothetical protein|nr:hypothetical protein [Candidatus Sysuiplasma jiujiangense]MBX8639656.1 hypothetical protein [Candidatus Sysuiplasma jiujiangense]MBX8641206.1 hypothetical protein [Candidatus Sysuiplasma jiujiangense]